jgi:hypothetical protein
MADMGSVTTGCTAKTAAARKARRVPFVSVQGGAEEDPAAEEREAAEEAEAAAKEAEVDEAEDAQHEYEAAWRRGKITARARWKRRRALHMWMNTFTALNPFGSMALEKPKAARFKIRLIRKERTVRGRYGLLRAERLSDKGCPQQSLLNN